jgi:hypothetical protein
MTWIEAELIQLDLEEYASLLIALAGLSAYLFYLSYTSYQRFRHISGTATSKIRSASQGYVELKGLGEWMPGDQMHTPFSQKRCLWYHCTIEKKERVGKRTSWTNILTRTSDQIFHMVDETGYCVIDPEDAHVVPESRQTWYGSTQDVPPPTTKTGSLFGRIGLGNYRFTEEIIRPATQIYVLGFFKTIQKNITNETISTRVEDLIRHWKIQPDRYLSSYDIDKNGVIQKHEWKLIRLDARRQILNKVEKENEPIHLISNPIENSSPFILSAIDEERLIFTKKWVSYSSIVIAFLLFVAIVICISIRPFSF